MGEGRFGPAYRARDDATGLFAAIKVFDQGLTAEQAARLASALTRLQDAPLAHPAIVPVIAAGVEGERPWVAEPWLDATPLDALMRRDGALPFADVLLRVAQVAGALDFAAAVGIHHGALHPRDILVSGDETLVVGIGVLQALNEAGLAVPMEGSYVAPQRAQGSPVTRADDVFALAAITYELVYGEPVPPRWKLRTAVTPLAGIDHVRLAELFASALSPDAAHRPSRALAWAESIQVIRIPIPVPDSASPVRDAASPVKDSESLVRDSASLVPDSASTATAREQDAPLAPPVREIDPAITARDAHASLADLPLRARDAAPELLHPTLHPSIDSTPSRPASLHRHDREELEPDVEASAPSRESVEVGYWFPVSATLAIGLLMGFAGGYVVGQREAVPTPRSAERAVTRNQQPATPEGTGGRDFTESVLPPTATEGDRPQGAPDQPSAPANQGTERAPNQRTPNYRTEGTTRTEQPEPFERGVLQVDSRPRGARVFLDGRLVGTTPVVVSDVTPGAHAVRIDLRGHRRWVTSVDVAPGERQRVAASLER